MIFDLGLYILQFILESEQFFYFLNLYVFVPPKIQSPKVIGIIVITIILICLIKALTLSKKNTNSSVLGSFSMDKNDTSTSINQDRGWISNSDHENMMKVTITSDKDFLENMIPHYQEAVDSSMLIINSTNDQDLKKFAQVINDLQTKEITQMKNWYKNWFGQDYVENMKYNKMIPADLAEKTGMDLEKEYVKNMVYHHLGAIDMAKQIEVITEREEMKKNFNRIITDQTNDVELFKDWLDTKYKNT